MTRLHVPIRLRWSDLDAYGHVNNARLLTLFEEARIRAFWATDEGVESDLIGVGDANPAVLEFGAGTSTQMVIAAQQVAYLTPVPFLRHPLDIEMWIGRLGGASLDVYYEVYSPAGVEPRVRFAMAKTSIVLVDAVTGRPTRFGERERAAWSPYTDDPLEFRR